MSLLANSATALDPIGATYRLVLTIFLLCIICLYGAVLVTSVLKYIRLGRRGYEEARSQRKGRDLWWERMGKKSWQKELASWNIVLEDNNESSTLKEINRSWDVLRPSYFGSLFALVSLLVILVGVWTPIQQGGTQLFWQYLTAAFPYTLFIVVISIGYARGVSILRKEASGQVTYADLRERRLTDYRSTLFRLLPMLFIASLLLLTLLSLPYLNATLPIPLPGGSQMSISSWIIGVMLLLMCLVLLLTEIQIGRVVALPRLLLLSSPEKAQQIDNLFRAKVIGELQSFAFLSLSYFGVLTFVLIQAALSKAAGPTQIVTVIALLLWIALFIGAAVSKGRLGGKISGWPWQRRQQGKEVLG